MKKLDNLISISNKVMKVLYVLVLFVLIYIAYLLIKEWKIIETILILLKTILPLFIGYFIAWILSPMINKIERKGIKKPLAIIIVYTIFLVILGLLMYIFIKSMYSEVNNFVQIIPDIMKDISNFFDSILSNFGQYKIRVNLDTYMNNLTSSTIKNLPEYTLNTVTAIFSGLGTLLISLVIGFCLLFRKEENRVINLLPNKIRKEADNVISRLNILLRDYIQGMVIVSLSLGLVSTISFALIGLRSPILFGLICGITDIIPYIGGFIGGILVVIVAFSMSSKIGWITLIVYSVIQVIETSIFKTMITSKTVKIHPIPVILALLVFTKLWGFIGVLLSAPIMAVFKILFDYFKEYIKQKKLRED